MVKKSTFPAQVSKTSEKSFFLSLESKFAPMFKPIISPLTRFFRRVLTLFIPSLLKPKLLISYEREYFKSSFSDCRLTLDKKISYAIFDGNNKLFFKDYRISDEMIIELKYPANINQNLINDKLEMPFRLSKNSKYVNGMNKYYLKCF